MASVNGKNVESSPRASSSPSAHLLPSSPTPASSSLLFVPPSLSPALQPTHPRETKPGNRIATVKRKTKETDITVTINLDGTGICKANSSIPFLDHMLDQLASHGLFDVTVQATVRAASPKDIHSP